MLLLLFWYCHKRGREVRLEKERQLTEEEVQKLDVEWRAENSSEPPTTTAERGASIEAVKAGMKEVESAKEALAVADSERPPRAVDPKIVPPTTVPK